MQGSIFHHVRVRVRVRTLGKILSLASEDRAKNSKFKIHVKVSRIGEVNSTGREQVRSYIVTRIDLIPISKIWFAEAYRVPYIVHRTSYILLFHAT